MERQPTKPVPIPTSSRKKRKTELDLAIESIRQDVTEKAESEPMEKDFDPEDFEKFFGAPKQKREEVSDEQYEADTADLFAESGKQFLKKIERFNDLMAHWKTMPDYDVDFKADLHWLEENVAPHMERRQRNIQSMQQACPFHPLEPLKVLNPDTMSAHQVRRVIARNASSQHADASNEPLAKRPVFILAVAVRW